MKHLPDQRAFQKSALLINVYKKPLVGTNPDTNSIHKSSHSRLFLKWMLLFFKIDAKISQFSQENSCVAVFLHKVASHY